MRWLVLAWELDVDTMISCFFPDFPLPLVVLERLGKTYVLAAIGSKEPRPEKFASDIGGSSSFCMP